MRISVRRTIETYGTTEIAEAMGLPISTLHGWKMADAIPGKGALHDMKVRAFEAAVQSLKGAPKRKKAA